MSSASSTVSSLIPTKDTSTVQTGPSPQPEQEPAETQSGVTLFDIAHVVDTKIGELLTSLEESNSEINARLDQLASRVVGLQKHTEQEPESELT